MAAVPAQPEVRVSTIELFFDLVFVYTVTQLTHLIDHAHGPDDFVHAFVVLVLIWWIYAGYAWLTNGVGAARQMRIVLIAAAAGFLVLSQAIPGSFGEHTLAFALSYLFVIGLHLGAFAWQGAGLGAALARLAPFNLGAAGLVLAAAFAPQAWKLALFGAAALIYLCATLLRREAGFSINAGHFVERHGLVILIVLGESVVAIAAGSEARGFTPQGVAEIALSLVLVAVLWWVYFDRDDQRAEHAMRIAGPKARGRMAIVGYWYGHLAMICGVVVVAAGIRQALGTDAEAHGAAWLVSCGVAVYLAGDVLFRVALHLAPLAFRAFGAAAAPAFGLVGVSAGAATELAALALLVAAVLAAERRLSTGRAMVP